MPWYIYDGYGNVQHGPFKTRSDAIYNLDHFKRYSSANATTGWVVSYAGEEEKKSGEIQIASLLGFVGVVLSWFTSTKTGRKFFLFLMIFIGYVYVKNAWDNRAYIEKTYYENGNIKIEQSFKSKKLNGTSKYYLEDGKLEKEQNYKDGELEGVSTEYYNNGNIKEQLNYRAGKLNGLSSFYLENGIVSKEQTYKDDVKNGSSKVYYPNGKLKGEAMIVNNKLHGLSILYDEQGKILRKEKFENGKSTNIIE